MSTDAHSSCPTLWHTAPTMLTPTGLIRSLERRMTGNIAHRLKIEPDRLYASDGKDPVSRDSNRHFRTVNTRTSGNGKRYNMSRTAALGRPSRTPGRETTGGMARSANPNTSAQDNKTLNSAILEVEKRRLPGDRIDIPSLSMGAGQHDQNPVR